VKTRNGKSMPCDPELVSEYVVDDKPTESPRRLILLDPNGSVHSAWRASVLTSGSREISGYVVHWSTCPKAKEFRA
jgi:hypothetical protein